MKARRQVFQKAFGGACALVGLLLPACSSGPTTDAAAPVAEGTSTAPPNASAPAPASATPVASAATPPPSASAGPEAAPPAWGSVGGTCMEADPPPDPKASPTDLPATADRIPVVTLPAAYSGGAWSKTSIGACSLQFGLRAVASNDALYVQLSDDADFEESVVHVVFAETKGKQGQPPRELAWKIAEPTGKATRVEGNVDLDVKRAVNQHKDTKQVMLRIGRIAGFDRVTLVHDNGVQIWSSSCDAQAHETLGSFADTGRHCAAKNGSLEPVP